ncbi:uncharacterized protein LOC113312565 [Papaver somniferum]|uniref:uncharacterized protein LOC113312565 n=1 Tax=Papaver somniferum TaxID=3469 RepID=UPI000E6FB6BB|nr:uncharacterized protein LOC113312565 [Papaver somniferum]
MTKEYVILPEPTHNFGYGFGYIPLTNEYKVVALCKSSNFIEVMVYTLGSDNIGWRSVGMFIHAGQCDTDINGRLGVFVNGALYWVHDGREILVFYLAEERFYLHIRLPPQGGYLMDDKIGVLGGFLFHTMRYSYSDDSAASHDVWLYKKKNDNDDMKQQDVTKEFKLPAEEILDFTRSGGILTYSSNNLNLYDPKTSTSKTLAFFREGFRRVFPHRNTLLSLEELGEEDTEIMKSR